MRAISDQHCTRLSAFLAQCMAESSRLEELEEDILATAAERMKMTERPWPCSPEALANRLYAAENGNRGERSGDGWKYRGRGLLRLRGREDYTDVARSLNARYLEEPDLVAEPVHACLTAAWLWHSAKLNLLADAALVDAIAWRIRARTGDMGHHLQSNPHAAKRFA